MAKIANPKIKRALVSVSNKEGIVEFCSSLSNDYGIEIISTGGTLKTLLEAGIDAIDISDHTGFPEMMDGRVKTLHPKVHGGILARRDIDQEVMAENQIKEIDLVVVNLYPFIETIAKEDTTLEIAIENIDIGGPSMVRSAAKNNLFVGVVVEPGDYKSVLEEISKNKGAPRMMSVQNPYSLVNRTYEIGMSEISIRQKCGLLVYYPLAAGALSGKYRNGEMPKNSRMALFKGWERHLNPLAMRAYDEYYKLAKDFNLTMVQLAQSFVNSRPFVTSNIIGATTMEQLKENIDSVNIDFTDEMMERVDKIHNENPNPSP